MNNAIFSTDRAGYIHRRSLLSLTLCSIGALLAVFSFAAAPAAPKAGNKELAPARRDTTRSVPSRRAPGGKGQETTPAGSWTVIASPNVGPDRNNYLFDVTCVSDSLCWAVGQHKDPSNSYLGQTLIQKWDGTSWTIVPSPNTSPTQLNQLRSVTCNSESDCWAVGHYLIDNNIRQNLIVHWDGNSWTIVPSPNGGDMRYNNLQGVTCLSPTFCWAVGSYQPDFYSRTLIERWDGNAWTIVPSPSFQYQFQGLGDVTCTSPTYCLAVGNHTEDSNGERLSLKWDGMDWSIVDSPSPNYSDNYGFNSVACLSPSQCWAVGDGYTNGEEYNYTVIGQWNGASWTRNYSAKPDPGSLRNYLEDVACPSTSLCWAVGRYENGTESSYESRALFELWNGNIWQVIASPSTSPSDHGLVGIACTSNSECWAVGDKSVLYTSSQTLIEKYSLTNPPLLKAVSRMTHGDAGTFDLELPQTGNPGVECRTSSSLGAGNYTIVFTFINELAEVGSASLASQDGSVSSSAMGPNANQYTVSLSGITNSQTITVTLNNAIDGQNNTGNVSATMGVLLGDTNADRSVNSGDISQTKAQSGSLVGSTNFRQDVNADGNLNSGDISLVKSKSGAGLP